MKTIKKSYMSLFHLIAMIVLIITGLWLTIAKDFNLAIFFDVAFQNAFYVFSVFIFIYILLIQLLQNLDMKKNGIYIIGFCAIITAILACIILKLWHPSLLFLIPICLFSLVATYLGFKIYLYDSKRSNEISIQVKKINLQKLQSDKKFANYVIWFVINAIASVFLLVIPSQINDTFFALIVFFIGEIVLLVLSIMKNYSLRKIASVGYKGIVICIIAMVVASIVFCLITLVKGEHLFIFRSLVCIAIILATNVFNDVNDYYYAIKALTYSEHSK